MDKVSASPPSSVCQAEGWGSATVPWVVFGLWGRAWHIFEKLSRLVCVIPVAVGIADPSAGLPFQCPWVLSWTCGAAR